MYYTTDDDKPGEILEGGDTKSIVTIIDDDKPGVIGFEEEKQIEAIASREVAQINIVRYNGCDGEVTVDYKTVADTAKAGLDYEHTEGTLRFGHCES